jgi:HK97 family phage portal protein
MMRYLLNCGNAYAFIERTGKYTGEVRGLWQLDSRRMNIRREEGGGLIYRYESPTGAEYTDYRQNQILHIVGPTKNGVYGKSVISSARESIGLAIAAEDYGASFFANGAHLSGLLTHPGARDEKQEKNILTSWRKKYSGHGKTGSIGMLWGGMDYKQIGVAPDDAQFLQTRKQQKEDIAAMFRVPKWMVGADDKTGVGGKDTEQKGIWFVMYSLRPWLVRFEQALQTQLIKKAGYFAEFNIDGLLRGDAKSRNEAYQIQRQNGVITINQWRQKENMNPAMDADGNPIPEADEYQLMNIWTNLKQMSMDAIAPTEPAEETSEGAVGGEAEGGNRTRD